jgi:hypothetical protein
VAISAADRRSAALAGLAVCSCSDPSNCGSSPEKRATDTARSPEPGNTSPPNCALVSDFDLGGTDAPEAKTLAGIEENTEDPIPADDRGADRTDTSARRDPWVGIPARHRRHRPPLRRPRCGVPGAAVEQTPPLLRGRSRQHTDLPRCVADVRPLAPLRSDHGVDRRHEIAERASSDNVIAS